MSVLQHILSGAGSLLDPTPLSRPVMPGGGLPANITSGYRRDLANVGSDFATAIGSVSNTNLNGGKVHERGQPADAQGPTNARTAARPAGERDAS